MNLEVLPWNLLFSKPPDFSTEDSSSVSNCRGFGVGGCYDPVLQLLQCSSLVPAPRFPSQVPDTYESPSVLLETVLYLSVLVVGPVVNFTGFSRLFGTPSPFHLPLPGLYKRGGRRCSQHSYLAQVTSTDSPHQDVYSSISVNLFTVLLLIAVIRTILPLTGVC